MARQARAASGMTRLRCVCMLMAALMAGAFQPPLPRGDMARRSQARRPVGIVAGPDPVPEGQLVSNLELYELQRE
jgi:hypothetical protein